MVIGFETAVSGNVLLILAIVSFTLIFAQLSVKMNVLESY